MYRQKVKEVNNNILFKKNIVLNKFILLTFLTDVDFVVCFLNIYTII